MTLFDEKKITCYHEFNNSYPAAMKINDQIWFDAKQYCKKILELNEIFVYMFYLKFLLK